MARFLILFNAPEKMTAFMNRSTSEERQAGMSAWEQWKQETEKTVQFEFGAVVQAVCTVKLGKTGISENQTTNYAFANAGSKEDVIRALESHPHLQRVDSSIEILEFLSMAQ